MTAEITTPEDWLHFICGACQLLDVVKGEWGESWSEWDQSIRDGLSDILQAHSLPAPLPDVPALPAPPAQPSPQASELHAKGTKS